MNEILIGAFIITMALIGGAAYLIIAQARSTRWGIVCALLAAVMAGWGLPYAGETANLSSFPAIEAVLGFLESIQFLILGGVALMLVLDGIGDYLKVRNRNAIPAGVAGPVAPARPLTGRERISFAFSIIKMVVGAVVVLYSTIHMIQEVQGLRNEKDCYVLAERVQSANLTSKSDNEIQCGFWKGDFGVTVPGKKIVKPIETWSPTINNMLTREGIDAEIIKLESVGYYFTDSQKLTSVTAIYALKTKGELVRGGKVIKAGTIKNATTIIPWDMDLQASNLEIKKLLKTFESTAATNLTLPPPVGEVMSGVSGSSGLPSTYIPTTFSDD
jgi:hypothetical protein